MGKPERRKTRGVVGVDEDSEEEDKPVALAFHHRQVGSLLLLLLLLSFSRIQQPISS
jgi:hypothetical protein